MISGKRTINAAECADRAGKHAFGLNDNKTVIALRKLADHIEAGTVVLNSSQLLHTQRMKSSQFVKS
jgi:hypothetical protein